MNKIQKIIDELFDLGLIIKGLNGLLECIGGVILFSISSESITNALKYIFQYELVQDPADFLVNYLLNISQNLSLGGQSFWAAYLLVHGIVKLGIVACLLHKKSWSYILGGSVLSILVIYEILKFTQTHSVFLFLIAFIDITLIILLMFEYKRLPSKRSKD